MSSEDLGAYSQVDTAKFDAYFQDATHKQFNFKLSAKADHYNEETRLRHVVRQVEDVDYEDKIKRMAKELKENGIGLPDGFNAKNYSL